MSETLRDSSENGDNRTANVDATHATSFEKNAGNILKSGGNVLEQAAATQLKSMLLEARKPYDEASAGMKNTCWNDYVNSINSFRKDYADLPPVTEAYADFKLRISDALQQTDAVALLHIFDEEAKTYSKTDIKDVIDRTILGVPKGFLEAATRQLKLYKCLLKLT